jgi:hypothetical protein
VPGESLAVCLKTRSASLASLYSLIHSPGANSFHARSTRMRRIALPHESDPYIPLFHPLASFFSWCQLLARSPYTNASHFSPGVSSLCAQRSYAASPHSTGSIRRVRRV